MAEKAILYDASKCTACRGCQVICKQWNGNDEIIPSPSSGDRVAVKSRGTYENPPDLAPDTWIKMKFTEAESSGKMRWLFTRRSCMHCTDAGCVRACPNGTLYHNEFGTVSYNKDTCIGCGYCIPACPFDVPRLKGNRITGIAKADKCTFCTTQGLDRIVEGMEPACVKTCPPGALAYGEREAMVVLGRQRVDLLKSRGVGGANLYGENELNGLHVLYVLEDSPGAYGLPVNPRVPGATIAWKDVIQPVGWAVGGLTILGLGMNWLVARANAKKEEK
ncbi:MAG: hypothetical protein A2Z29_06275 [Chloroflexi bacterium RBG_16_56_11]|nr:MAG: hypothetical protein A2Z29_06275 [Chloroflexi bacterium RBG_16_56_11]